MFIMFVILLGFYLLFVTYRRINVKRVWRDDYK